MSVNLELDYYQVKDLIMQMPDEDRRRLCDEVTRMSIAAEPGVPFGPQSHEEVVSRLEAAENDIENGRVELVDDLIDRLRTKYSWARK